MAKQETLQAEKREVSGTSAAKRLRRDGIVPAVVYGSQQREYSIQVNTKAFTDVFKRQSSSNFLVNLEISGADEASKLAMVQDIQQNPLSGEVIHIDFHAVREDETVHANIPVELVGDSAGVKAGGLLDHLLHSIEIHCRPADLPDRVTYDVTELEIGESVHVSDLEFPEDVSTHVDDDVVVAICISSRATVSEEASGTGEEGEEGEEGEGAEGEGAEGEEGSSDSE
ncbi:MAG: 50S ribosomal protein L25 [Verrucomicrobiales bacterium]|nr:50S ribosomal protein L25 [Verrucomicrobiales bacterium]